MRNCRNALIALLTFAVSLTAVAQDHEAELQAEMAAAQARLEAEAARHAEERERAAELQTREVELAMKEAEERMAAAARQMAELSQRVLPDFGRYVGMGRPVLGITIGGGGEAPVTGVEIVGISPGGAAAEAGLRAGDVITSVNSETLTSDRATEANRKLLDFMEGVEEGDVLDIEYLRNGKSASVEVTPRPVTARAFAFGDPDFDIHVSPLPRGFQFGWRSNGSVWGDMELVVLNEKLGRYFGTDQGLLVVNAPDNDELRLQDGDVIQSIDGREPTSAPHAMRILGSYESGEELSIQIMRDKRKQTLQVQMPENRRSAVMDRTVPRVRSRVILTPEPPRPVDERT